MAIKRVDITDDSFEELGWGWMSSRDVETLVITVSGQLCFTDEEGNSIFIAQKEIPYWLQALKEAQEYFNSENK